MAIKKKSSLFPPSPLVSLLLAGTGVLFLVTLFFPRNKEEVPIRPYSQFLEQVERGQVARVKVGNQLILYQLKSTLPELGNPADLFKIPADPLQSPPTNNPLHVPENSPPSLGQSPDNTAEEGQLLATIPLDDPSLPERLQKRGVIFEASPPPTNNWLITILSWVVPSLILVFAMQFLLYRNDDSRSLAFGKAKAKMYVEGESEKITFAEVAGAEEAKTELEEIVEFLKNPDRFSRIGARIPKGVLLVGPPGTGKTLLAKAVAGEAGVTFFSMSASEFVELFVGTGAARVRDLFAQAKEQAPCIIFIDELDAIGKSRSGGNGFQSGSSDEREQTLNQLLTEMDGFNASESTVIVLAATNRPETLDSALLRPGRFDRQVLVDRPDLIGRLAILQVHAQKVKLSEDVDLKAIATQTPGFAGADLANLVNEAALLAARDRQETVSQGDFKEAIERVIAGLEKKSRVLSATEKKIVAYHEVGHALVGAVMPGGGKVSKISIIPRGLSALGYTLKIPTEDRFLMNDVEFQQQIAMLLGGRAAEEIIFQTVTNGASDDLQRATEIAERMVTLYGMSQTLGPLAYNQSGQPQFLGSNVSNPRRLVSEETARAIDEEVKQLVGLAHQSAIAILRQNQDLLEQIAEELLKREVLEGEELQKFLNQVRWDF